MPIAAGIQDTDPPSNGLCKLEFTTIFLRVPQRTEVRFCSTIIHVCLGVEEATQQSLPLKAAQIQDRLRLTGRDEV